MTKAPAALDPLDAAVPPAVPLLNENGPIVVLSYAFAGAESLTSLLSGSPSLACTSGTGLIPLCHAALGCWQQADDRAGSPSALAIKSVRALAGTMITAIQVRAGTARWCETALAPPAAADSFLQVFPSAAFVCVHRDLAGVVTDGLRAYPWGLAGSPFWPYSVAHPGNSVAAIAAYWATASESLLEFEARRRLSCLRLKREDLVADPRATAARLLSYLELDAIDAASALAQAVSHDDPSVPVKLIPPELLRRISRIQAELGYVGKADLTTTPDLANTGSRTLEVGQRS